MNGSDTFIIVPRGAVTVVSRPDRRGNGQAPDPKSLFSSACMLVSADDRAVLSTIRYSKSPSLAKAVKMRCHTLLALRLNRRKALLQDPKTSGGSRQGKPARTIHNTASMNIRLSRPDEPRVRSSPMMCCDIRAHCSSPKISRSSEELRSAVE